MADFCIQCADDLGIPQGDLSGLTEKGDWKRGLARVVICEGCGFIQVDPEGRCISDDCLKGGHKGGDMNP